MLKPATAMLMTALVLGVAALPALAQGKAPVRPPVQPRHEQRSYPAPEVPDSVDVTRGIPESEVQRLPSRQWRDETALDDAGIEAETATLKQERAVRVKAIATFEEELRKAAAQVRRNPSEQQLKDLRYRQALVNYRIAVENREIRQINSRLEALSRERARRRNETTPEVAERARDLTNIQQARAALALLTEYDAALEDVLQREPVTESDVIYALGLLHEKAEVARFVADYLRLLEEEMAGGAGAAAAPTTTPPTTAPTPETP